MLEREFPAKVIKEIKDRLPGCIVLKNDASYIQGIPDLLVLHNNRWGMLECKKAKTSKHQANQDYYVNKANSMSFARIIFPENKEEVLNDLQQALQS